MPSLWEWLQALEGKIQPDQLGALGGPGPAESFGLGTITLPEPKPEESWGAQNNRRIEERWAQPGGPNAGAVPPVVPDSNHIGNFISGGAATFGLGVSPDDVRSGLSRAAPLAKSFGAGAIGPFGTTPAQVPERPSAPIGATSNPAIADLYRGTEERVGPWTPPPGSAESRASAPSGAAWADRDGPRAETPTLASRFGFSEGKYDGTPEQRRGASRGIFEAGDFRNSHRYGVADVTGDGWDRARAYLDNKYPTAPREDPMDLQIAAQKKMLEYERNLPGKDGYTVGEDLIRGAKADELTLAGQMRIEQERAGVRPGAPPSSKDALDKAKLDAYNRWITATNAKSALIGSGEAPDSPKVKAADELIAIASEALSAL